MKNILPEQDILEKVKENDRKSMLAIEKAFDKGLIDADARRYFENLYGDGIKWFREVFYILGKCLGAPKAAVMKYNYAKGEVESRPIKISEINPLSAYMVSHCLEKDPMGNQFFNMDSDSHNVRVSASSIVNVIIAAQKNVRRALEKLQKKYYPRYVNEVADTAYRVISEKARDASAVAIADKIRERFSSGFITNASETVLGIIGGGHENISAQLVRELDKIVKPYMQIKDIWRAKCLFELIPQARSFMETVRREMPDRIISITDKFYNIDNPRNYRDIKIILNIGRFGEFIPMEIICQVRKIFEFERLNHEEYEIARKSPDSVSVKLEKKMARGMEQGIKEYNNTICNAVSALFDRVGWNILYGKRRGGLLFDGFPEISKQYYPDKMVNIILEHVDTAVKDGVFNVPTAPTVLEKQEETEIFRWMTRFILNSAMPYKTGLITIHEKSQAEILFNFVMKEIQKYYRK